MLNDRWSRQQRTFRLSSQAGFTLVELMISLTVVSVAIAAAFAMAFSLMNGFKGHRSAVQVESTSRIVLDIITAGVRSASPGLVKGLVFDTCQGIDVSTIDVINSSSAPDELRMIHAFGGALASTIQAHDVVSDTLNVVDNSSFEEGIFVPAIIIDPLSGKGHLIEVLAPSGSSTTMQTQLGCAGGAAGAEDFPAGSLVVRAVQMHYRVDPPYLFVDPDGPGPEAEIVMAAGIEDLQIAVAVENNVNVASITDIGLGQDDDEWHYNFDLEAAPPTVDIGGWTALRISVVGYAFFGQESGGVAGVRPATEDRPAGAIDLKRRRTYTTTVGLRNFSAGN